MKANIKFQEFKTKVVNCMIYKNKMSNFYFVEITTFKELLTAFIIANCIR